MDEPKPTYRSIFGAYWRRISQFVEVWWVGFGVVMVCIVHAVYAARQPEYLASFSQQTVATGSVLLGITVFLLTIGYELL
jgi:hypothetical protein